MVKANRIFDRRREEFRQILAAFYVVRYEFNKEQKHPKTKPDTAHAYSSKLNIELGKLLQAATAWDDVLSSAPCSNITYLDNLRNAIHRLYQAVRVCFDESEVSMEPSKTFDSVFQAGYCFKNALGWIIDNEPDHAQHHETSSMVNEREICMEVKCKRLLL